VGLEGWGRTHESCLHRLSGFSQDVAVANKTLEEEIENYLSYALNQ
jgi:hypothetical protein